jgi:hypothetical protein
MAWRRRDGVALETILAEAAADGARSEDLSCIRAAWATVAGHPDDARVLVREIAGMPGIVASSLIMIAGVAVQLGETELALAALARPLLSRLAPTLVRLDATLHPLLDRVPFTPRRRDVTLVWPLEASMIDSVRFRLFREVRIESGRAEGSGTR